MKPFAVIILLAIACVGCKAPLIVVNRTYNVEMNGAGNNDVRVQVDKDETVSPSTTGVQVKLK